MSNLRMDSNPLEAKLSPTFLTHYHAIPHSEVSYMAHSTSSSTTLNTRGRLKKRAKMDKIMGDNEKPDLISRLPNDVLTHILSSLSIDEAVRSSVLSKRWMNLWRNTSHIEFNGKHMIRPLTQLLHSREPRIIPNLTLDASMHKGVYRYGFLVYLIVHRHYGDISSCRFLHFRKSLAYGEVESWVEFVLKKKKGVKDLSLECEPDYGETAKHFVSMDDIHKPRFPPGIFASLSSIELINYTIDYWYAFVGCNNLRKLKLKRMYMDEVTLNGILENCVALEKFSLLESTGFNRLIIIKQSLKVLQLQALCVDGVEVSCQNLEVLLLDSIICPVKSVSIYAPSLRDFRSYCYSIFGRMLSVKEGKSILKNHEILSHCSDLLEPPCCNIFPNLSTLSMDLDLNCIREAMVLSCVLRLCTSLQALEIALPVFEHKYFGSFNDCALPYPTSMFWKRLELCNCIRQKLKFVYIRGFRGKEQEVEFAKYLIARATIMKRITVISNDSIEEAESLLSLPRACSNLSINLKVNANNPMD